MANCLFQILKNTLTLGYHPKKIIPFMLQRSSKSSKYQLWLIGSNISKQFHMINPTTNLIRHIWQHLILTANERSKESMASSNMNTKEENKS